MDNYRIEFSNKSKTPFEVGYRTFNSQTSLTLPGRNSVNYGKDLNTCFFHLLESFSNDIPPVNPVEGQTWYDYENKTLRVYNTDRWERIGMMDQPTVPTDAVGPSEMQTIVDQYLKNDIGEMVGPLLLKETSIDDPDQAAVTKRYVDSQQPPIMPDLVPLSGNKIPLTGNVIVDNVPIYESLQAVTKIYAEENTPTILKTKDNLVTVPGNSAKNLINIVKLSPHNQIHIFGCISLLGSNAFRDVPLTGIGNIMNASLSITKTGTVNNTVSVSARLIAHNNAIDTIRVVKHGDLTVPVNVYFTITGDIV